MSDDGHVRVEVDERRRPRLELEDALHVGAEHDPRVVVGELGGIAEGDTVTVKWRGKPVFVRHRTPDEIADAEAVDIKTLRDQETDAARVLKSEWLVVLGVCTHLGCVPLVNQGEYNGWFCH